MIKTDNNKTGESKMTDHVTKKTNGGRAMKTRPTLNEVREITIADLKLTQEAYATGGQFPLHEGTYSGNWYEAHAKDANGNEYMVYWINCDWDAEDESDACDWEKPYCIRKI